MVVGAIVAGPKEIGQAVIEEGLGVDLSMVPSLKNGVKGLANKLGDLTKVEIKQIQGVVNQAGRPLEIVGSAAKSKRRGVGTNLPLGKGPGKKSDIDVLIPTSSTGHFNGLTDKLPDADVNVGTANSNIGPSIRFEPES